MLLSKQEKLYQAIMTAVKDAQQQYAKYKTAISLCNQYWEWEKYVAALNHAQGLNEAYQLIYGSYAVDSIQSVIWE